MPGNAKESATYSRVSSQAGRGATGGSRLGEGAADFAPTAPHATPGTKAALRRTKVGRIWKPLRLVLSAAVVLSIVVHGAVAVKTIGDAPDVELEDVDDPLTIPVDLFDPADPAPAPPPPPNPASPGGEGPGGPDAGAKPVQDAGVPSPHDAGADAEAPVAKPKPDAGAAPLAEGLDAGAGDAGAGDTSGPRDPGAMVGLANLAHAGPVNVTLLINMAAIRQHPVGRRIGPLISAIPQWESFVKGADTHVEPLRDTEWIIIYGPSLMRTEKTAVVLHYSLPDSAVDSAIAATATGGPFETGVAGVKATLGHADNADRVFVRGNSKMLAVVPPENAKDFARMVKAKSKPHISATEAMRLIVKNPWRQISINKLKFPRELDELRVWIVPNADGSATAHAEGSVDAPEHCEQVAENMTQVFHALNTGMAKIATGGLLDKLKISCEDGVPKSELIASQRQLEQMLTLAGMALGAPLGQ